MNTTELLDFKKQTNAIFSLIKQMENNYQQVQQEGKVFDFFTEIERFVNDTEKVMTSWQKLAYSFVKQHESKYIYKEQIDQTVENINILAVIHFQKDTRYKRFVDLIASVKYIIGTINDQLNKG
jgi:peptidoglycan hydrolase CwlO-like protein